MTSVALAMTISPTAEPVTAILLEQIHQHARMVYANVTAQEHVLAKAQLLAKNVLLALEVSLGSQKQIKLVAHNASALEDQETVSSPHILGLSLQCQGDAS